ncbi:MAG: type II toxin-antitoxin system RelE/ParE family toxin [Taibaiella sp.]|nr:type II toxin-antitoxin system RelE/ParE family toxin [Taibaiella sp.]
MVKKKRKIIIDDLALTQLNQAYNYIRKDSPQNAIKVRNDIFSSANSLSANPEKYPLDKFKNHNDGTYRAFEKHHYRIIYRVLETEIRIIMIRNTSMQPLEH